MTYLILREEWTGSVVHYVTVDTEMCGSDYGGDVGGYKSTSVTYFILRQE